MIKFLGAVGSAALLVAVVQVSVAHDMSSARDMSEMHMSDMHIADTAAPKQTAAVEPNTITIDNFTFGPQTITVTAGTTVTWINHDDEPHTVVNEGAPRLFKSQALDTDDKFAFRFDKPGTYQYFCSIHPHMTGTVVVK